MGVEGLSEEGRVFSSVQARGSFFTFFDSSHEHRSTEAVLQLASQRPARLERTPAALATNKITQKAERYAQLSLTVATVLVDCQSGSAGPIRARPVDDQCALC